MNWRANSATKTGKNTGVQVEFVKNDENFPKFAAKIEKQLN